LHFILLCIHKLNSRTGANLVWFRGEPALQFDALQALLRERCGSFLTAPYGSLKGN